MHDETVELIHLIFASTEIVRGFYGNKGTDPSPFFPSLPVSF
jgi:hypothetical protein